MTSAPIGIGEAGWNGLELRHLVAMAAVADHGTISRAAEVLGYTQSAVSQQIAALERVVGAPVFDRPGGPRPLTRTPAGDVLLIHARTVLAQLRMAEADVRAVVAGEQGTLRVGTVQSVGTRVLPDVLRRFHGDRPGVQVTLRESHDPRELLALVASGDLDVTFCELPLPEGPWRHREVLVDPFVLLAPAGSPEASLPAVGKAEIVDLPLIGYRNDACASNHGILEAMGRQPLYVFQSDDNTTIQGCVGAGLGYALVPRLAIDLDDPAVRRGAPDPEPARGSSASRGRRSATTRPPSAPSSTACTPPATRSTAASLAGTAAG